MQSAGFRRRPRTWPAAPSSGTPDSSSAASRPRLAATTALLYTSPKSSSHVRSCGRWACKQASGRARSGDKRSGKALALQLHGPGPAGNHNVGLCRAQPGPSLPQPPARTWASRVSLAMRAGVESSARRSARSTSTPSRLSDPAASCEWVSWGFRGSLAFSSATSGQHVAGRPEPAPHRWPAHSSSCMLPFAAAAAVCTHLVAHAPQHRQALPCDVLRGDHGPAVQDRPVQRHLRYHSGRSSGPTWAAGGSGMGLEALGEARACCAAWERSHKRSGRCMAAPSHAASWKTASQQQPRGSPTAA